MNSTELTAGIEALKKERKAVLLAHYYQLAEVQEIADHTGDSYALSKLAASTIAEVIVFCGVHFMAESAAILSPEKTVLLPEPRSGCPLADTITADSLRECKEKHPGAAVVCYVNSSARTKALSDICCTSSNAVKVVESLAEEKIIFVPDCNLAAYVASKTNKEIIPWAGHCPAHNAVTAADVERARQLYPDAVVTVHPECRPEVVAVADHVGSTADILRFARETTSKEIIVGTEKGIHYLLQKESPHKQFHFLSPALYCPDMKKIDLSKILCALESMQPRIAVDEEIRTAANRALERMLLVS